MSVFQATQFRLYPNKAQAAALDQWIGACRWCWNQFLEYEQYLYDKTGRFAFHKELSANLPEMKRVAGYEWLKDIPAIALVDVSRSMDLALRDFLARRGTSKPAGFPQFRKKRDLAGSVYLSGQVVTLEPSRAEPKKARGHVKLPKVGRMRIRGGWWPHGRVKAATIKRDGERWFLSVRYEAAPPRPMPAPERETQGLDWGLSRHVTDDRGASVAPPRHLYMLERRLRRAQRALSRSERGANRRRRKVAEVRRLHRKVRDARADFSHKLSRTLIAKARVTAVEDLSIKGMMGNDKLARAVADAAWSATVEKMAYKADWHGRTLVRHGRFERSTGVCPEDGTTIARPPLHRRVWTCPTCGTVHDRDVAAARVIRLTAENPVGQGMSEPSRSGGTTRVESGVQRRRGRGLRRRSAAQGSANIAVASTPDLVGD